MNSYPPELLTQLAPLMFAAGLDAPPPATPATPSGKGQDPYALLISRLREVLISQRKPAVWQPEKNKTFQVVHVDKDVRFPPRKLAPDDSHYNAAHSPLSPLTPSSPLYPDGLIAPIWVRKHTALVPAVFVLFTRLYEAPQQLPSSPLEGVDPDRAREREQEERRRDAELAADIAQRKKATNERGMKLTVVLIASRRLLDDPSLDARLTFIRRSSGLDSRAALFVLSPVSPAELTEFAKSLQEALYEPAVDYYTAHSKRVRRKRNRHAQSGPAYSTPLTPGTATTKPLRPEGWTVRYEYKMACFAEFRGEDEVALKHYQDAYNMLVIMFGSPVILPPRTKRWAEAKVLVDCINIKICKLYLYNNEHALALGHYMSHVRRFGDLSRGWGIGEDTFEFWSWTARQHRVLAELVEQGTRAGLQIPTHSPARGPTPAELAVQQMRGEAEGALAPGLNPSHALQHPGFYYFMAARCTEERRLRFLAAEEEEVRTNRPSSAPGFANEKKVEHLPIILELYTRAYELFKKHSASGQGQGRQTLLIAHRIAETYYADGKFDMAVRFFERIAKTYRRERWSAMLKPLLGTWYRCAQRLGDVELSVRLLVEMMAYDAKMDDDEEGTVQDDMLAVLKSSVPSSPDEPFVVDIPEAESILDASIVFWEAEVTVGQPAAYQLTLRARPGAEIGEVPFASVGVHFSADEGAGPVVLRHAAGTGSAGGVQFVDAGRGGTEGEADLRFSPGKTLVVAGTIVPDTPGVLEVARIVLTIKQSAWSIEIPQKLPPSVHVSDLALAPGVSGARWLSSVDPVRFIAVKRDDCSTATVRHRPHQLHVSLTHDAPAYIDEEYPILIDITNIDDRELDVELNVLLQPSDVDGAVNHIVIDNEKSTGLIKGIPLGVMKPGVNVLKRLYLVSTGTAGDRILDISVQSRPVTVAQTLAPPATPAAPMTPLTAALVDATETLETLVVPTANAVKATFTTTYRRSQRASDGLSDLHTFDSDYWDEVEGGEAVVEAAMACVGPWSIQVESVSLVREDGPNATVLDCSLDDGVDDWLDEWQSGDEFCDICRISLATDESDGSAIPGPGLYELKWRRVPQDGSEPGPLSTSCFALPTLRPPADTLIGLLDVPATAKLHTPLTMTLTVRNRHPTRSANCIVQVDSDPADAFILAGVRTARLPILLPGTEERLVWRLVPVECGFVRLPKVAVVDRRKAYTSEGEVEAMGEPVRIVDVRWDGRKEEEARDGSVSSDEEDEDPRPKVGTVLVLP